MGAELTSWICITAALPFAALGFISYQGMTFEKIVVVSFYSFLLNRKDLISKPINIYYEATKGIIVKDIKEASKRDKKLYKALKAEQRKSRIAA